MVEVACLCTTPHLPTLSNTLLGTKIYLNMSTGRVPTLKMWMRVYIPVGQVSREEQVENGGKLANAATILGPERGMGSLDRKERGRAQATDALQEERPHLADRGLRMGAFEDACGGGTLLDVAHAVLEIPVEVLQEGFCAVLREEKRYRPGKGLRDRWITHGLISNKCGRSGGGWGCLREKELLLLENKNIGTKSGIETENTEHRRKS